MAAPELRQLIPVETAAFFHPECNHPQLFHSEYKRSNRTKGLKILRCFPHCCPEHIDRSYCGTSLSLRVQLAQGSIQQGQDPPPNETLVVFARFEAVSDVSLRPGECVEVDRIAAETQSNSNLEAQWVAGVLDRPSRLVTTICTPGMPSNDHKPLVFHLNGKPFSRWYYDWESGANKAQRLTKHVIKAYVFERCAVDQDGNFTAFTAPQAHTLLYRVVHVATSPEFTVISYRRAPSDAYQAAPSGGEYQTAWEGGAASTFVNRPVHEPAPDDGGNPANVLSHTHVSSSSYRVSARTISPRSRTRSAAHPRAQKRPERPERPAATAPDPDELLQDALRWEHANLPAVSVSKNLALVYSFLRWAPLSLYASFADGLVRLIHTKFEVNQLRTAESDDTLDCFSKTLLDQIDKYSAFTTIHRGQDAGRKPVWSPAITALLRVLSELTMWVFSEDTQQWLRVFFRQYAASVLDKNAMRECFLLFLKELEDRMDARVFASSDLLSLANAAEEIIVAVYSCEYFRSRRHRVRQILSGQCFSGWNAFVAQMRETYISMSARPGVRRSLTSVPDLNFVQAHQPRNIVERDWQGEWLMNVNKAAWEFTEARDFSGVIDEATGPISFFSLIETISQLAHLEIAMDLLGGSLFVRSTQGVSGPLNATRLVLDGKDRVFSMFPNGMSSSVDGVSGDYIGEIEAVQPDQVVVFLQLFDWCFSDERPSYYLRMRIKCGGDCRLCVDGDILTTAAGALFTPEEALRLKEMRLREKCTAATETHLRFIRESAGSSPTADWKQLGKFSLPYCKL